MCGHVEKSNIFGGPGAVSRAGRKSATKVFENFRRAFSPYATDCPWVSEDGKATKVKWIERMNSDILEYKKKPRKWCEVMQK